MGHNVRIWLYVVYDVDWVHRRGIYLRKACNCESTLVVVGGSWLGFPDTTKEMGQRTKNSQKFP